MNKELQEIIDILKKLLSFKTIEGNDKEFKELFNYIKSIMPKSLFINEYTFNNHEAMVISNTLDTNLDLVFCTHIDVVPATCYSFTEDENIIKGRGTFDMKGSVAVALKIFLDLNTKKKVGLFITADEEITGYSAMQLLSIYNTKFAIVPDGGKNLQIVKEEKGQLQLKVTCKTKSAHASQPYNGVNAIVKLYDIYEKLILKYPLPISRDDYRTSVNLSTISGGNALNSVPEEATMCLDIRHTFKDSKDEIMKYIKSISDDAEIQIIHAGSLFKTDLENHYVKKYLKISKSILGKDVEKVATEATSDAIYFSQKNIPTILTNPVGDYAHCPNEFILKESLLDLFKIWKEFIIRGDDKDE